MNLFQFLLHQLRSVLAGILTKLRQPSIRVIDVPRIIVKCESCGQKLRIPRSRKRIRVTCPSCRKDFNYQYFAFGVSSHSLRLLIKPKNLKAYTPVLTALLGVLLFAGGTILVIANRDVLGSWQVIIGGILCFAGIAGMVYSYRKL